MNTSATKQTQLNATFWKHADVVHFYANRPLKKVEKHILSSYPPSAKVLELGCGAGGLTQALCQTHQHVDAIDISPTMVACCQKQCPQAHVSVADIQNLSQFQNRMFNGIFAIYNIIDVLDHNARSQLLASLHRLLTPKGLLVFSSHNRAFKAKIGPNTHLLLGNPRHPLQSLRRLPTRLHNRRQLRQLECETSEYAIINDAAHDFSLLHYYIDRDAQEQQLNAHGFKLLECLDLQGNLVKLGGKATHCPELHYIAQHQPRPF